MPTAAAGYRIARLGPGDEVEARRVLVTMAEVFGEERSALGDEYVARLLVREDLWILAATQGDAVVGGLTAHTLPMTRSESSEIFIYDIAVRADHQRRGVGRQLVARLREAARAAGIRDLFVPADDEDAHALEFYRALGATATPVTFFTFGA
jgi:aminoglycoside 3-N-acetyltransferase I